MRKLFLLSVLGMSAITSMGQPVMSMPMAVDKSNINLSEVNWQKIKESGAGYSPGVFTIVNGEEIYGLPFLYGDWENGSILTANNRLVSKYMLRYNIYNQSIMFLNGKDSMEVDEGVKEFSLTLHHGLPDTVETMRFVNGGQL